MSAEVIAAIQHKYIRKFTQAEAFDIDKAKTLEELGLRDRFIFRRMVAAGVFKSSDNIKYYLDTKELSNYRMRRLKIVLALVVIIILLIIII